MKTIYKLLLLILSAGFVSCEKEIEFTGDIADDFIVVNSYVSSDSLISAHLSKSRFFLSNESDFNLVENAIVGVYINHKFKENMMYFGNGRYQGSFAPADNDTVELKVNVEGENEVSAQAILPDKVNVTLKDTVRKTTSSDIYDFSDYVSNAVVCTSRFTLIDNPDQMNFYRITLKRRLYTDGSLSWENYEYFDLQGLNNQGNNIFELISGNTGNYAGSHVISDELFNGKDLILKIEVMFNEMVLKPGATEDPKNGSQSEHIIVNFQGISREMYLYLITKNASENNIGNIFSEPVVIYNNINKGIGILGAYSNHEIDIKLY